MHIALLVALALVPPLLLVVFFYLQDRVEPEPHAYVLGAFAIGILAVAPALVFEQRLEYSLPLLAASPAGDAYVIAAFVEESTKLFLLMASAYTWAEFDEPFDGIVYATAVSLGFAATENALYVLRGGASVAALRALFTVPGHGLCGALAGYYVGHAKFTKSPVRKPLLIAIGLLAATVVHGTFDYVILVTSGWRTLGLLSLLSVGMWVLVLHRMRRARAASPFLIQ